MFQSELSEHSVASFNMSSEKVTSGQPAIDPVDVRSWVQDESYYRKYRGTVKSMATKARNILEKLDLTGEGVDRGVVRQQYKLIAGGANVLQAALEAYITALKQDKNTTRLILDAIIKDSNAYINTYVEENRDIADKVQEYLARTKQLSPKSSTAGQTGSPGIITIEDNPSSSNASGTSKDPPRDKDMETKLEAEQNLLVVEVDSYIGTIKKMIDSHGSKSGMERRIEKITKTVEQFKVINSS